MFDAVPDDEAYCIDGFTLTGVPLEGGNPIPMMSEVPIVSLFTLVPILHSYRGTSLIRNSAFLGPYSTIMSRALWWSEGGGGLMSEVPLYWHDANV